MKRTINRIVPESERGDCRWSNAKQLNTYRRHVGRHPLAKHNNGHPLEWTAVAFDLRR
jgi:hypothetical protein